MNQKVFRMPLTNADYRVRSSYFVPTLSSNPFQNVWYFKRINGVDLSEALLTGFISDFLPAYNLLLPDFVDSAVTIEVESLFDLDDFSIGANVVDGLFASTEASPEFVALGLQIVRSTRQNKRHGSKRFGPLSEQMTNGSVPSLLYLTNINAALAIFNADITDGANRFRVAIPRSIEEDNPNAPPDKVYVIQDLFPMEAMIFGHVTTQNSRKSF